MATYRCLFVIPGAQVRRIAREGAPDDRWLCDKAIRYQAAFAIRYRPTLKGWVVLDTRNAVHIVHAPHGRNYKVYDGHVRINRVFPTEDAAVMYALHRADVR